MRRIIAFAALWLIGIALTLAQGIEGMFGTSAAGDLHSSPRVEIKTCEQHVGNIAAGRTLIVEFPIRNTGAARLMIWPDVLCPCDEESLPTLRVLPGEAATIRIPVEAPTVAGILRREFTFWTNDQTLPHLSVAVQADVTAH